MFINVLIWLLSQRHVGSDRSQEMRRPIHAAGAHHHVHERRRPVASANDAAAKLQQELWCDAYRHGDETEQAPREVSPADVGVTAGETGDDSPRSTQWDVAGRERVAQQR